MLLRGSGLLGAENVFRLVMKLIEILRLGSQKKSSSLAAQKERKEYLISSDPFAVERNRNSHQDKVSRVLRELQRFVILQ